MVVVSMVVVSMVVVSMVVVMVSMVVVSVVVGTKIGAMTHKYFFINKLCQRDNKL